MRISEPTSRNLIRWIKILVNELTIAGCAAKVKIS
jgi:hypothetical protein